MSSLSLLVSAAAASLEAATYFWAAAATAAAFFASASFAAAFASPSDLAFSTSSLAFFSAADLAASALAALDSAKDAADLALAAADLAASASAAAFSFSDLALPMASAASLFFLFTSSFRVFNADSDSVFAFCNSDSLVLTFPCISCNCLVTASATSLVWVARPAELAANLFTSSTTSGLAGKATALAANAMISNDLLIAMANCMRIGLQVAAPC